MKNTVKITVFEDLYTTEVSKKNSFQLNWEKLAERLQKPTITTDKNSAKMFNGARFRDGGKRCGADLIEQTLLVLDVDEGWHPEMFRREFEKYEFVMYASYNHNYNKTTGEVDTEVMKFRAVFPLAKPLTGS